MRLEHWFYTMPLRFRSLFRRRQVEAELDEELRYHLERKTEQFITQGLSPEEARYAALRAMDGLEQRKEECRDMRRVNSIESFLRDLRYGLRMLRKSPGFTAVAVITLALGVGSNTAMFSVVNGVLLSPLPYPQPDQLVALYVTFAQVRSQGVMVSYPDFLDWKKNNQTFEYLAAYREDDFVLTGTGETQLLRGEMVSASFFPVFGVKPVIGRLFRADEDRLGAEPVAVISAGLWERKFGSSPEMLGKPITLRGTRCVVVGVIPASFHFDRSNDVYVPIGQSHDEELRDRKDHAVLVVGRLKAGVTVAQARADMGGIARNLAIQYPESNRDLDVSLVSLKKDIVGDVRSFLLVLLGAVGFVLLIGCANVANLLLARSTVRMREFAVRAAMGASWWNIIRQVLTETTLIAAVGGGLGLLMAVWGTEGAIRFLPETVPRAEEVGIDTRVLVFTAAVSLLAGILFGLTPALKASQPNLREALKEGGRGSGTRHRAQDIIVATEMALALVLLVGAGLMIRSMARLWTESPGCNPNKVLTYSLSIPAAVRASPAQTRAYFEQLQDRLDSIPGVEASSVLVGGLPLSANSYVVRFWLEGRPKPTTMSDMDRALFHVVEPDYFKAMGIPLEKGRTLSSQDDQHSPFVIVIDDVFAHQVFGDQDPVGKRVNLTLGFPQAQIVGVVGHVKRVGLDSDAGQHTRVQLYCRFVQLRDKHLLQFSSSVTVVMRTEGAPMAMVASVRHLLKEMNGEQVMYEEKTMDDMVSNSLAARRFSMILLGAFAGVALVLASLGIYGVVSYAVVQRTQEIGIRMALGASARDVLRMVVWQGMRLALIGLLIGVMAASALTPLMASLLYRVGVSDPLVLASVAILLSAVALVAIYIPARRATRVDPVLAMRLE